MRNVILVSGFNGVPKIYEYFKQELETKGYKVFIPDCPLRDEITWDGYRRALDALNDKFDGSIIVAHSIGCAMSVKYVAESNVKPFAYISLVGFAQPFETPNRPDLDKGVAETTVHTNTGKRFAELVANRFSIYSDNDHIVPMELLEEFPMIINSKAVFIPGIGHMGKKIGLEKLPEVIDIIEKLDN